MTTSDTAMTQVMREEIVDQQAKTLVVDDWISKTERKVEDIKQRFDVSTPPTKSDSES